MNINFDLLIDQATSAMEHAYAPYSNFKVGSAVLCDDGRIWTGCNIENAAYGPSNCAERTALFRAIAEGHQPKTFIALAVVGHTDMPISPCGTCRQVMAELCSPDMPVFMSNLKGDMKQLSVKALLPSAFVL